MTQRALLIEVRWPDGRFHGVREATERVRGGGAVAPEWPPSPFRLFQALVAGAYGGRWPATDDAQEKREAFEWLEGLPPPVISAPATLALNNVTYFVPNNDLDTKDGDPARVGEIRAAKVLRASLFDPERPVVYVWRFERDEAPARRMAGYAERLHTLGQGIDAAFARAEVLDLAEAEARLAALAGAPRRPSRTGNGSVAPCPATGSLNSLLLRHAAFRNRLAQEGSGRKSVTRFRQPPKAHARAVAYDARPEALVFELRPLDGRRPFAPWPLKRAGALAIAVRDLLARQLGEERPEVRRLVVGTKDAGPGDLGQRVRIVPLPSIGGAHTDPSLRRVLVEVPADCPLPLADVRWALAGRALRRASPKTGEVIEESLLVPTTDQSMLGHYGAGERGEARRRWRTVTPAALPQGAARRRIDPARLAARAEGEAKGGAEREAEEARAAGAVVQALRHAGVRARPLDIRVQREPFDRKGERADAFAPGTRFPKERLWHVEATFAEPVRGPLMIGDGRFCGLGLMRSERESPRDLFSFAVTSDRPLSPPSPPALIQAVRRALMSRADERSQATRSQAAMDLFSGHGEDGAPARSGRHRHAYLATLDEGERLMLLIIAPWRVDRSWSPSRGQRDDFDAVVGGLSLVRAGRLGMLRLQVDDAEPALTGRSRVWRSASPYTPDRHPRRGADAAAAVVEEVIAACRRLGLPGPEATSPPRAAGGGWDVELRFRRPVAGPILIGRDAHTGGGLLLPAEPA